MSSSKSGAASGGAAGHVHTNPMDQYVNALPSPTAGAAGAAASVRAIIHQALTNPKILSGFAELRSHPAVVAALDRSGAGDDPALHTLDLFAKGTYSDYSSAAPGTYLTLTDGQLTKLRQLTVVSVAQRIAAGASSSTIAGTTGGKKNKTKKGGGNKKKKGGANATATTVSYDVLRSELGMETSADGSVRDLEDVLISCIYAGLIIGRLDQRSMSLWLEPSSDHPGQPPVAARDVTLEDVPRMIEELERFQSRSLNVLTALEDASKSSKEGRAADAKVVLTNEAAAQKAKKKEEARLASLGGGGDDGWSASLAAAVGAGPAAMDLSMEGRSSGSIARRQTKRSRGGHGGGEGRF